MFDKTKLQFAATGWAWTLVTVASFIQRRRMSHNSGVVASGRLRIVASPQFPPHDFLQAGRAFSCRIRHAPVSFDDETIVQVRSATIKFADTSWESPLDIEMNTGRYSFFWNATTWFTFVNAKEMTDGRQYRAYYRKYPAALAGADGIRHNPSSFAQLYYHSQVAQYFIGKDGVKRYVKFRLIPFDRGPETGIIPPDKLEEVWDERVVNPKLSPNYLKNEYAARVSRGPVKYVLQLQLHTPRADEDQQVVLNCNLEWDPASHPFMDVATVEIDEVLPWEEECRMRTSVSNCPPSLALIPATSMEDMNGINYLRAKSDVAKHARVLTYRVFNAWPKRQPDDRGQGLSPADAEGGAHMDISLPQNDKDPSARRKELEEAQGHCTYDFTVLPPLPMAASVPEDACPSLEWKAEVAEALLTLTVNSHKLNEVVDASREKYQGVRDTVTTERNPITRIFDELSDMVKSAGLSGRAGHVDHFSRLFKEVPRPPQTTTYLHDATFARMRVAGPAPVQIRRMHERDSRFPVTDAMLRTALGHDHDSLDAAIAEGRLYLADYAALDGAPGGTFPSVQKYIAAPLALFAVPMGKLHHRPLAPIAIQLGQRPGSDNPIFTPADGPGWEVAKSFVQTADGNLHQAVHHLSRTHLVIEAIALATHRQLPPQHPLGSLLRMHMEGTLSINDAAVKNLICPQGGVDTVMACRIDAVHDLIRKSVEEYHFDDAMLPAELEGRGVADATVLPEYPYRDDAKLVWDAIRPWIDGYVRHYYASSADVLADLELQAWIGEIVSPDGGRMKGIGQGGRIETIEYLVQALTHIVFTASAQHAAVNFPQLPIMSFAPAVPLAAYIAPPTSKAGITHQTYLDLLPPLDQANYQLVLGYLLGSVNHTKLGKYTTRWGFDPFNKVATLLGAERVGFYDAHVEPLLTAFQKSLDAVETTIQERNATRAPYEFLLPSRIPQSINI